MPQEESGEPLDLRSQLSVTFFQVPGLPPAVQNHSTPFLSQSISPRACRPDVGLPAVVCGINRSAALAPVKSPPYEAPRPRTPDEFADEPDTPGALFEAPCTP